MFGPAISNNGYNGSNGFIQLFKAVGNDLYFKIPFNTGDDFNYVGIYFDYKGTNFIGTSPTGEYISISVVYKFVSDDDWTIEPTITPVRYYHADLTFNAVNTLILDALELPLSHGANHTKIYAIKISSNAVTNPTHSPGFIMNSHWQIDLSDPERGIF